MDAFLVDKEFLKKMIKECLELGSELKQVKREVRVKRNGNTRLQQHNKMMSDKNKLLNETSLEVDQYQDVMNLKKCSVKLEDVDSGRERRTEKNFYENVDFMINNGQFVCKHSRCEKLFKCRNDFLKHQLTHNGNQCQVCQLCFQLPSQLRFHLRTHTNERRFVCDWVGCGQRFKQKHHLESHIKFEHSNERPFVCDQFGCGVSFKTKYALNRHSKWSHTQSQLTLQFVCKHPGCGKQFKHRIYLQHHQKIHTTKYQCQECQKCFGNIVHLRRHLQIHTGERPFECDWDGCGKRFKNKEELSQHFKWKHSNERPFHCDREGCEKTFKLKAELKVHVETVHSSLRLFQCQIKGCEKSFKQRKILARHLKSVHF